MLIQISPLAVHDHPRIGILVAEDLWGKPKPAGRDIWRNPLRVASPAYLSVYAHNQPFTTLMRGHDVLPEDWLQMVKLATGAYEEFRRRGIPAQLIQLGHPCEERVIADGGEPDLTKLCRAALSKGEETW